MRSSFLSIAALLLAGCAAVPHDQPVVTKIAAASAGLGGESPAIGGRWWDAFGDPQLRRLIDAGLAANPTLDAALARVRAAQAEIAVRHADQLPQVNGDTSLTGIRYNEHYLVPPPYAGTDRAVGQVQAGLSWDLDLFGRQRALVAKARASAQAAQLDADAARLTISTSIAQTYVGLARADRQIEVAEGFVETRRKSLAYVQSLTRNNLANQIEVRTAETLLAEAEQAKVRAERQRELLIHALAALAGRGADYYATITPPALVLDSPPVVPDVLPADLLGRRADISAARWRVEAANSDVKVAKAAFYPNINLTAFVGLQSIGLDELVKSGSRNYGIGPALTLPIFDSGRLRSNLRGKTADVDAAVESYNAAVIDAVHDVADQISSIQSIARQQVEQERAQASAESAYDLATQRYKAGLGTYLTVLNAETSVLTQRRLAADLKARALDSQVALIRALGGGYRETDNDTRTARSGN